MGTGPILLLDKSALQSVTLDESVMLDQFFLTNIAPVFLGQLACEARSLRAERADDFQQLSRYRQRTLPHVHCPGRDSARARYPSR